MDGARSAARTIQNNLLDNSKQEAIDILLVGSTLNSELADRARILLPSNILQGERTGQTPSQKKTRIHFFLSSFTAPIPVLRELCKRYNEYTTPADLRIGVATYNVNGGKHFRSVVYKDLSLCDWLLDSHKMARSRCKFFFIISYIRRCPLKPCFISYSFQLWSISVIQTMDRPNRATYLRLVSRKLSI